MSSSNQSGFGQFVPGFEFMQNLARQATGGLAQGVQQAVPHLPNLGSWVAPTFNVEDLEKRIQELKAVHFWLDQNTRALSATIQALEVQKMTLTTLQGMNLSMTDVANALKAKATDTMASMAGFAGMGARGAAAPAPDAPAEAAGGSVPNQFAGLEIPPRRGAPVADEPAPAAPPEPAAATPDAGASSGPAASMPGVIDPMQWWGALSQQFQSIAAQAMADPAGQAALDAGKHMATTLTREAIRTATDVVAQTAAMANPLKGSAQEAAPAAAPPTPKASRAPKARATGSVGADATETPRPAKKAPTRAAPKAAASRAGKAPVSGAKKPSGRTG